MQSFRTALLVLIVVTLASATTVDAAVVGEWRMETDTNADTGFSVPNEVAGGNALTGVAGSIDSAVPVNPIPQTAAVNTGSLNGGPDINGNVAWYGALDSNSITVEYWARSNEGDARMILRQSGTEGLRIDNPDNVRVQYSTASGQVSFNTGLNHDGNWDHFAFTYDQNTGVGQAYVNGNPAGSNSGPEGEALTWPAATALSVGNGMDGGGGLSTTDQGFFDELRISNIALSSRKLLNAPDSGVLANSTFSQSGQTIGDYTFDVNDHGPMDTWLLTDDGIGGPGDQWRISSETLVLNQGTSSEAQAALQWVPDNQTAKGLGFLQFDLDWDDNGAVTPDEIDLWAYVFGWNEGDTVPMSDVQNGSIGQGDDFDLNGGTNLVRDLSGDSPYILINNNATTIAGLTEGDGFETVWIPVDFAQGFDYVGVIFYGEASGGASLVLDNVQFIVPEPASLAVWGLLAALGLALTRRRKR